MKGRTIRRHFRESMKSLGRNRWMTFASISAVTVTLLLVGVFILIMMNLNKASIDIENDVEIRVHIDLISDPAEAKKVEKQLMDEIHSMTEVDEVKYSSRDEELGKLIDSYGDDLSLYEQSNPLYNVFYVKAVNPQQTEAVAKKIEQLDHVNQVKYGEGKIEKLFNVINISRNAGLILILGLLFTAIFLISNTIRITIIARKNEIEIMRLVGAANSFIRVPFMLEGVWIGMLGALAPMAIVSILYINIYQGVTPRIEGELLQLLPIAPLLYQVNLLLLMIGVLIGAGGSFMSVRKFLKI